MQCPTHVTKLVEITADQEGAKSCNICTRKSSIKCSTCKFSLCSKCRICTQTECKMGVKQKVKPEYYNNSYSCNICSKSKVVNDNGIWHCNTCNYDVCDECLE